MRATVICSEFNIFEWLRRVNRLGSTSASFAIHGSRGTRALNIAICIPARNESRYLRRLFDALESLDHADAVHICLLLDGCTDASEAMSAEYRAASRHAVRIQRVAASPANAGRARRRALALGLKALGDPNGLLLTTDADSAPSPHWLVTMAAGLREADVVAGRIVRSGERPNALQDRLEAYYDALFVLRRRLDPVPWEAPVTHHYTGGANLGIRAGAYRAIGGFVALPSGEDARLIDDAARAGFRVRRDAASVVRTSDRRHGRAGAGLAMALRQLDGGEAASIRVTHPADAAWQYRMHAVARSAFDQDRLGPVATALGLTLDHVRGVARDSRNGEAFATCIVPAVSGGMRTVSLPVAEAELGEIAGARRAA